MIRLALGTLRQHRGAYAGTFFAALLAVALLVGGGLLLASVLTAKPPANSVRGSVDRRLGRPRRHPREGHHQAEEGQVQGQTQGQVRAAHRCRIAAGRPRRTAGRPSGCRVGGRGRRLPVQASTPDGRPLRGADDAR
ncbi:hypothetical protein NKG94_05330 [Micromonospora sp. M12]